MTWIDGKETATFDIKAPLEKVYTFFSTPDEIAKAYDDIERSEKIDAQTVRWFRKERGAKGVSLKPECTIRYGGNGKDRAEWSTIGTGNLRSNGTVKMKSKGPGLTEIQYEEVLASDLPIPGLMASVFRPIVVHEIKKGVREFLDAAKRVLEQG